jgi:AraC family transcriptional regulator of adaptative response / DNA-3-methyladenine glycosylase II
VLRFLGVRAVPGVEEVVDGAYRRVLDLPSGSGTVTLADGGDHVTCTVRLADVADLGAAVARCRRLLDLDADPVAVADQLGADPVLAPLVAAAPGTRVPGHVDGAELAVRAVLGQQVSVAGARTLAGRLVAAHGAPLPVPDGGLTSRFPTAEAVASADPATFGIPRRRGQALVGLAAAIADGTVRLDPGVDRDAAEQSLLRLPGIGPWTASYIRMRALGDPDALLVGDLGVRHALERLGRAGDPRSLATSAERWRPWRAYAAIHLWQSLDRPSEATTAPARPARPRPARRRPAHARGAGATEETS